MKHLTLFILAFFILGCSKEKSKKWLVADITVIDEYTGEPLKCNMILKWKTEALFGSTTHSFDLGDTDSSGKLHIERKISRKDYNFTVDITADHLHYSFPGMYDPQKSIGLLQTASNIRTVKIPSKSYVVVSITNANCGGPTDTLLLRSVFGNDHNNLGYFEFTGCVDTILNEQHAYAGYLIYPSLNLEYVVKRGAQIDTFQEVHTLTPKEFTPININY